MEQVGAKVTTVLPSDPVLLSYLSCSECYSCESGHPAYCTKLFEINFHGEKGVYAAPGAEDFDIGGGFFGQSSFSNHAIVKARCVVNLAGLGVSKHELLVLPPLGCGVQTGAGAMVNIADVGPQHHVAIIGVGGVGQSAVMASLIFNKKAKY